MTSLSPPPPELFPRTRAGMLRRPALWLVLGRAVTELALARWRLGRRQVRDVMGAGALPALPLAKSGSSEKSTSLTARVAWAIPRVAARVPWRSDCLVQATAAQRWLSRKGVPTDLHIGVRKDRAIGFEAHAWLCHNEQIITGGDISGFVPLVPRANQAGSPSGDRMPVSAE